MAKQYTIGTTGIDSVQIGGDAGLFLIAGPCVIESRELCFTIAEYLKKLTDKLGIGYIFKASFDKANRTSGDSFRGPGLQKGLRILQDVRAEFSVPVVSDIHLPEQAAICGEVLDVLQIPAFLSRQTDLLEAAAKTGKCIQVKKAQFAAPADMKNVITKITTTGNEKITLVERGSSFGYNRLVCDMTAIAQMQRFGYPVVIDATHSTQQPGGLGDRSGGNPEMAPILAKASIAAGADGLFIETHPNPDEGLSDAACMLPMDQMEKLLICCADIYRCVR